MIDCFHRIWTLLAAMLIAAPTPTFTVQIAGHGSVVVFRFGAGSDSRKFHTDADAPSDDSHL